MKGLPRILVCYFGGIHCFYLHSKFVSGLFLRYSILNIFKSVLDFSTLIAGLLLLACMLLFGTANLALTCLFVPEHEQKSVGRIAIMRAFRHYLAILNFCNLVKIDVSDIDKLRSDGGIILAPNHPSLLDALLITSRLPNVVCVMKASVLKSVLFGKGAQIAGYIPNESVRDMVDAAAGELEKGSHLLLFPEGTRTIQGRPFTAKGSIAVIAKRAKAEVQTLLIETNSGFLGKSQSIFKAPKFPVHFRVRLGKRFAPPQNAKIFMNELDAYFRQQLQQSTWSDPMPRSAGHSPSASTSDNSTRSI